MNGSLSFTGNLNALLSVLFAGGTAWLTDGLHPKEWRGFLERERITHLYLIPAKLRALTRVEGLAGPALKMIFTGSQLLGEDTLLKLKAAFPTARLRCYYGASELSFIAWMEGEKLLRKPLCVGKPFPGVFIRIEGGKIMVRTPFRALGLPEEATAGDTGFIDGEGDLIFTGREDDLLNLSGCKVSAAKVEQTLLRLPGVEEAVVLPYRDQKAASGSVPLSPGKGIAGLGRVRWGKGFCPRRSPQSSSSSGRSPATTQANPTAPFSPPDWRSFKGKAQKALSRL